MTNLQLIRFGPSDNTKNSSPPHIYGQLILLPLSKEHNAPWLDDQMAISPRAMMQKKTNKEDGLECNVKQYSTKFMGHASLLVFIYEREPSQTH